EAVRVPQTPRAADVDQVVLEPVLVRLVEIGIGKVEGEQRVVIAQHRTQQKRPLSADREKEMGKIAGVAMVDALRAVGAPEGISVVVEHGEGVPMLLRTRPPFLQGSGGSDKELRRSRRAELHRLRSEKIRTVFHYISRRWLQAMVGTPAASAGNGMARRRWCNSRS